MRITIKDVARKSGFSVATVSLVLNGKECRVSEATRAKILRIASEMNYRPNHLAVSLVTRKTHTIGLIVPDVSNFHFAEMCMAIEQECRKNSYIVLLGSYGFSDGQAFEYFKAFIDKGVEGIIFAKPHTLNMSEEEEKCYTLAHDSKIPVVTFESVNTKARIRAVCFDFQQGGYLAAKHLIQYGHRKIGCITGPVNVKTSVARIEGYKQALDEAGIEYDPQLLYEGDFTLESGVNALPYLLGKGVTGIFAFNDMMALGVYKAARNYNLKIPKDISIVGFDDIFLDEILEVPLTSIAQTSQEMGRESARQILNLINGDEQKTEIIFRPILKVRGSTMRLPKND